MSRGWLSLGRRGWLLALLAFACAKEEPVAPGDLPVVTIRSADKRPVAQITVSQLRFAAARLRFERDETVYAAPLSEELQKHMVDRLIDERLLALEGERLGVKASTTAVARAMQRLRVDYGDREFQRLLMSTYQRPQDLQAAIEARLQAQQVLQREALAKIKVSDADLERLWNARAEREKVEPARIRAAQILVRTEDDGKKAQRSLARKEPFADVARRVSIGPEAVRGGDLGWFARGDMPKVFDEACFGLEPGKVSQLTASEFGYHLCKVLESKPERPLSFEEAKPKLKEQATEEAAREAETRYRQGLRDKHQIEINAERMKDAFS